MPYKTIAIKLRRPTKGKQALLDSALERYSRAFSLLLEDLREDAQSVGQLTRTACMQLLDTRRMGLVDHLEAQPFKDALKLDLSMLLSAWSDSGRPWPVARTEDDALHQLLDGEEVFSARQLDRLLRKHSRLRPLLFARHDPRRDYHLLEDKTTGRVYAKLYLQSRSGALPAPTVEHSRLVGLAPPHDPLHCPAKVRFVLLPLETGEWQQRHLEEIRGGTASPKSALLVQRRGEYFLHLRLWYELVMPAESGSYLGVARGMREPLYYAVCGNDGSVLESGGLRTREKAEKNQVHALANQVLALAKRHGSTVVLENLSRWGDGAEEKGRIPPLSHRLYTQFAETITYKAELAGLPLPVRVSPRRIYQRCPVCGIARKTNRYNSESMLCVSCGAFQPASLAASTNLALALLRYEETKIPVLVEQQGEDLIFLLHELDFRAAIPQSPFAVPAFCGQLENFLQDQHTGKTPRQMSIIKKLQGARSLEDSLNFSYTD